jgi:hypothetical protein
MKKSLRIASAIAILLAGFSQSLLAQTNYYWSNAAGGSWHTPSNWRTGTANGPVALVAPTRNDDVIISTSFPSAATITVTQASAAKSLTYNVTNRAVTLQVNAILEIAGSLLITNGTSTNKLSITTTATAAQIAAGTVAVKFTSPLTTPNATIQPGATNPTAFAAPVVFDGADGKWILQNSMTIGNSTVSISAKFVNGHLIALPSSIASDPSIYNDLLPSTETNTTTTSPMLIFTTTSATVYARAEGGSNASHVIGYVRKLSTDKDNLPEPMTFVFPVGDGVSYRPITMYKPSNSSGDFTARYLSANPYKPVPSVWKTLVINAPLNSVSDKEFWYFVGSGSANTNFSLNYMHPSASIRDFYRIDKWMGLTIAGLTVSSSGNAAWNDAGGAPSYVTNGTIPSAAGTSSSQAWFTIARRGSTPSRFT